MSGEQTRHYNLMISLPLAGLISGALTICVMLAPLGPRFPPQSPGFTGCIFGAVVGGFLAKAKVLRFEGWAWLVVVATAAHFIAYFSASWFQLLFPPENIVLPEVPVLSSLIVGGLVGGFVLLGAIGAFFRIRKERDLDTVTVIFMALLGAVCGGGLAAIGYALGPSLGSRLGRILTSHFTGWAYSPEADFGDANVAYSLYLVWQTGMAFVVALMLRKRKPLRQSNGSPD